MPALADRVQETSTTTGTGDLTLLGAVTNYQDIDTAIGQGVEFSYTIRHQSAAEWETGFGYLSATSTMVRNEVRESSNSNALVSFSAGTKDVFVTVIADMFVDIGQITAMMAGWATP